MDTLAQTFLAEIERHLAAKNIEASAFGKQALGDPNFVFDLKKGRSPSTRTMDKVA
jgi:2,4-dienoyl-CoA reductase-like NADH-dependent reductase (Old Yellow Enzyme family)